MLVTGMYQLPYLPLLSVKSLVSFTIMAPIYLTKMVKVTELFVCKKDLKLHNIWLNYRFNIDSSI